MRSSNGSNPWRLVSQPGRLRIASLGCRQRARRRHLVSQERAWSGVLNLQRDCLRQKLYNINWA